MRVLSLAWLCLLPLPLLATDITGRVVGVSDGDTFTLLTAERTEVKIRLAEIDAPERGQPYGNRSREALSELVFDKTVRVDVQTTDRYGRTVGRPYVGEVDVCAKMLRAGAAWVYREYLRDPSLLDEEQAAREADRGIWGLSESQRTPPWEWRRSGNQQGAKDGCNIKGNIGKDGDRIYHVPGAPSYGPTRIDESRGERWFCSEADARAAGWRPPR
jgi:endonuclease YncB( thermonuclease family)